MTTTTAKSSTRAKVPEVRALTKTARLEARIDPELAAMLKQAAEYKGLKVTEFVTSTLHEAAHRAIAEAHVFQLSLADQRSFAKAILDPSAPRPALKRAFARRRRLV